MPHRNVTWAPWIDGIITVDPCLGRVVREAVVAQEAALNAGAASPVSSRRCRSIYQSAEQTLDALRFGRIKPNTDAAWKRAADSLRKFTTALECAAPPSHAPLRGRR